MAYVVEGMTLIPQQLQRRSISGWYTSGSSVSSRDTDNSVETVFLYVPDDI